MNHPPSQSTPASVHGQTMLRPRPLLPAVLGGVALLAALAIQSGSSSADPASSASPSASAAASAAPDAGAALPRFDAEPFSDEKTERPTAAEWKPLKPVALTDPLPFDCNAYRLREWIKIRCSGLQSASIALLGGGREGVLVGVDPAAPDSFGVPRGGEVVFPVRRGDRRVFEWSTFGEAYDGIGFPILAFLISESWAPDEPGPRILAP
jgi:hypothetical protein